MNRRPGFALLISLLIALALSVVGLGAMAVGVRETLVARTVERRETARFRAEAAVQSALGEWSTRAFADLPIGGSRAVSRTESNLTVFRVDTALYVLRAEWADGATDPGGEGAVGRAAVLVRTFDSGRIADYLQATLTVQEAGTLDAGVVSVPDSCHGGIALHGGVTVSLDGAIEGIVVPSVPDTAGDPLPPDLVDRIATVRIGSATVRPRPIAFGSDCQADSLNWGAVQSTHPCHGLLPLVHAIGPLHVTGGAGRGIIVVDGDLTLDGGFRFQGILIVRGRLTIQDGAIIEGAIRTDSIDIRDGRVTRTPCDLTPILAAPALDRAFRPPSRWWIPVF